MELSIYNLNCWSESDTWHTHEGSGNINMSGGVSEDVHIHVLLETRSDDEIMRKSYWKWKSIVKW